VTVTDCALDYTSGGIFAYSTCDYVSVCSNTITNSYKDTGIYFETFTTSGIITGNTLTNIGNSTTSPSPLNPCGIYVNIPVSVITENTISEVGRNGIQVQGQSGSTGYGKTSFVSDNNVQNFMRGSADGGGIYGNAAWSDLTVQAILYPEGM